MRAAAPDARTAAILTIGSELVCGDVENTNAAWLGRELEGIGFEVVLVAALPDDPIRIARFVRRERCAIDALVVTGGLGGTPDDVTREAIALALDVELEDDLELASDLREACGHTAAFADLWSRRPRGSRPLKTSEGGAPGFAIENILVLPGLPDEMKAMFASVRDRLGRMPPAACWRQTLQTTEDALLETLDRVAQLHSSVAVGSYPRFEEGGAKVEIVLKARSAAALADAVASLERMLEL